MITTQYDHQIVIRNWGRINVPALKRSAGYVRKTMRSSIKRRPYRTKAGNKSKPSSPGKPPLSRHPSAPMKMIEFELIRGDTAAVVGPRYLPIKKQDKRVTPMEAHEEGATVTTRIPVPSSRGARKATRKQKEAAKLLALQGKIKRAKRRYITKQVRMPKRPFAQPALDKSTDKIVQFWKGSFNRAKSRVK